MGASSMCDKRQTRVVSGLHYVFVVAHHRCQLGKPQKSQEKLHTNTQGEWHSERQTDTRHRTMER